MLQSETYINSLTVPLSSLLPFDRFFFFCLSLLLDSKNWERHFILCTLRRINPKQTVGFHHLPSVRQCSSLTWCSLFFAHYGSNLFTFSLS